MNVLWIVVMAVIAVDVLFAIVVLAYVFLTEKNELDDEEEQRQEEQRRSDDLNDEFTKRLHELHATRFGKPMVDPRTVKRNVVLLKDRHLAKRKKD